MSFEERQVQDMQTSFISVLSDIEKALTNKQYDIAINMIKQEKKTLEGDLIENNKELV